MLRKLRTAAAVVFLTLITLLLLDISGSLAAWAGWTAKIQFLPALLALNIGVVVALLLLTLLLGRIYCSVICPMGVMQDIFARLHPKRKKHRYSYKPEAAKTRLIVLLLFCLCIIFGATQAAALIAPYSAFGRIVTSLFQPLWIWCNNLLASWAASHQSYLFSSHDLWLRSLPTAIVASLSLAVVAVTAWRTGRGWCNTVCPVGTILGYVAKYSLFRPVFDKSKCNSCGLCARNCKSHCIDPKAHSVDMSRCVACFNCLSACRQGAISYAPAWKRPTADAQENTQNQTTAKEGKNDPDRRSFLTVTGLLAAAAAVNAAEKKVDGGLAVIEDKVLPQRKTPIAPPGALSIANFTKRCTACQLCVSKCPNSVLRPSSELATLMQPTVEYDRGYCRPECTECSNVCPAGAITPITREEKTSIRVGYAVWIEKNCIVCTDSVECGNCARHCPTGAIIMVSSDKYGGRKIPTVNTDKCLGCGACQYLCPARPLGAIYVEGREIHSAR